MNIPEPDPADDRGAPDTPCATCGHEGHAHVLRETEVAGNTIRETFCEECNAMCEYVPVTG